MLIPDEFKGIYDGAFFKKPKVLCTFICYGEKSAEIKESFQKQGYILLEEVIGVNTRFVSAANDFAANKLGKNGESAVNIEEVIAYARKNPQL